jgi:hypothetical protein
MSDHFQKTVTIKAVDEEARTATGAVLVPDELDHQRDFFRPEAVERFHSEDPETGVMHAAFPDDAAEFERLEVIDESETIDGEQFPPGTLVGTRRYADDDLFALVADGVLTGFSIGGDVTAAEDHETLPEDVRVPEAVEYEDGPVTELIDGEINEVSDVDMPAVPRATYKGEDLGKSILEDVDGEAEFVAVMTEERGHSEADARRLYQYLTDARAKAATEKPFESPQGAEFEDFNDCVSTLMDSGMSRDRAERTCGAWQAETKVDVNGTEIDLTPPAGMVAAAQAAAEAGDEGLIPSECGTGDGDESRDAILDGSLSADAVRDIASYLVSHEADVTADGVPADWSDEEWSDCGNAQYAKWGGDGSGDPMRWAMRRVNDIDRARDEDLTYPEVENMFKNLDDPEFAVGDPVEWSSNDTTVRGRVADIGEEFSPAEGVTITGEEGEAVYLIHELDDSLEPPQYRRENVAKPESSLNESQADLPPTEGNFEDGTMTRTSDEPDDATKWRRFKAWLTGSDDAGTAEAPERTKATDGDDDEDDEEDDDEEMAADTDKDAPAGETADDNMSDSEDTTKTDDEPPAWAAELTEKVDAIDTRVSEMEADEDAEKAINDAPEWAQDLAAKVDDLDDRVEAISKQSGHSQQLGKADAEDSEKTNGFTLDPRKARGGD